MKQAALSLGPAAPPEIDHDAPPYAMPEYLPEWFPVLIEDLGEVAKDFCGVFGGCKNEAALKKHIRLYTEALAIFRQRGVPVAQAWQAFIDARTANGGEPLFGGKSKSALNYLPDRRSGPRPFAGPRVDSCGCPLPEGTVFPKLGNGETAHWDGDEFIIGNTCDPKRAHGR